MSGLAARPWTVHEDMFLRQLAADGKYAAAIAKQMKRSESAIRKRAALLHVKLTKVQRFRLKAKK
jgi:hypothetical protein